MSAAGTGPEPALRLQGVAKRFGGFQALRDVDLSIARGEFICFLGPSGCGKTTLLRIVAGLETPSAGRVSQAGRDITALPPAQRDYGIVFQSYALFPNLSVADNVSYGLVNRHWDRARIRARVAELLALVGLPGCESQYPSQLSGGQQQRIALARALAASPGLLLLDEPLSALDAIVRVRLRQEIRALQRQLGVTTIMVTHDQEEALAVADRIVVMNQGAIEQVGTPAEVYREPATPFVADFVGRINALRAERAGDGSLRLGTLALPSTVYGVAGTGAATVYVRPEDIRVAAGDAPGAFDAEVRAIEFLGDHCRVTVDAPALGGQSLDVALSPHLLAEQGLAPGSRLRLQLLPQRLRVFA